MVKTSIYIILCIFMFTSCWKKDDEKFNGLNSSPTYAIPLGNYELNANDEFNDLLKAINGVDSAYYNEAILYVGTDIEFSENVDFNLTTIPEQFNNIEILELSFRIINEYPTNFDMYVEFYESTGPLVWRVPETELSILGTLTNNNEPTITDQKFIMPDSVVNRLTDIRSMTFFIKLDTQSDDTDLVEFYDYNKLTFFIGAVVQINLNQ